MYEGFSMIKREKSNSVKSIERSKKNIWRDFEDCKRNGRKE